MFNKCRIYEALSGVRALEAADPPQSVRLNASLRQTINADLVRAGLDGNGKFQEIGQGLSKIGEVLARHGFQVGDVLNANLFMSDQGTRNFRLEKMNQGDSFSPFEVTNSMLALQWYKKKEADRVEVIAYLS